MLPSRVSRLLASCAMLQLQQAPNHELFVFTQTTPESKEKLHCTSPLLPRPQQLEKSTYGPEYTPPKPKAAPEPSKAELRKSFTPNTDVSQVSSTFQHLRSVGLTAVVTLR